MKYKMSHRIFDNILVFFLVMSTGGMLFVLNRNLMSVLFFILLLFGIFFLGVPLRKRIVNASIVTFFVVTLLGFVNYSFAIVDQSSNKYLFHFLTITISILFVFHFANNRENETFIKRLYFVLQLISLHALLNFFSYFFVKNSLTTVNSAFNEFETFKQIFYYATDKGIVNLFGFDFCRNQGFFWEPGVLQIFLNILFFLEAFIFRKNKLILLLTTFLILTTYSTTGLIILIIQFSIYNKSQIRERRLIFPLLVFLLLPITQIININFDEKFKGENQGSFQKRLFDLTQPFFIALENPVTGIGLDLFQFQKIREEFYISSSSLANINTLIGADSRIDTYITDKGSSNSVMFLFAATGFPTALLLLYMFFKQRIVQNNRALWLIILLFSIMSEPLLLRPFFFIFIISGFIYIFSKITSNKKLII